MKRTVLTLLLTVCLCTVAIAQNTVTVSGSNIVLADGKTKVADGTIYFQPTNSAGSAISYHVGGGGQASKLPVWATVTNGAFTVTLPNTTLTGPANVCFKAWAIDNETGRIVLGQSAPFYGQMPTGYDCVQPAGDNYWCSAGVCNFDNFQPNLAGIALVQNGPKGDKGDPGWNYDPNCGSDGNGNLNCSTVKVGTRVITSDIVSGSTLTAFGDSNTVGYGLANPTTDGYVYKLAAAKGWTLNNLAVSGTACWDNGASVFGQSVSGHYLINLGYNDMRAIGTDQTLQAAYQGCMYALASWLSMQPTQFVNAQAALATGSWTSMTLYGIAERYTGTAGGTLTFTTPPGSTVYLYGIAMRANTSYFAVSIDGVQMACNAQTNLCNGGSFSQDSGASFITAQGTIFGPQMWRFAGLVNQPHTVVVTATGPDAANFMHIIGVAAVGTSSSNYAGPQLILAQIPRMNATGYTQTCTNPPNCNNGSDAAVAQFNERIREVGAELAQDGLQVSLVDLSSTAVLDPTNSSLMQADNVHFSAAGHASIANAFVSEMTNLALPRDRAAGQGAKNVSYYNGSLYVGGPPSTNSRGELGTASGLTFGTVRFGLDGCGISRIGTTWSLACPLSLIQYGGSTAVYPALKLTGGAPPLIQARKADDSGDSDVQALNYRIGGNVVIPSTVAGYQGVGTKIPLPTFGVDTLSSGTVTVSNSAACTPSATCVYKLTNCGKNASSAIGTLSIGTVTAGTSFVINSLTSAAAVATGDASTVCWQIN